MDVLVSVVIQVYVHGVFCSPLVSVHAHCAGANVWRVAASTQ